MRSKEVALVPPFRTLKATRKTRRNLDRVIQPYLRATLLLVLVAAIDRFLALGESARLIYLVPAWILVERCDRNIATISVVFGVIMHAIVGRPDESHAILPSLAQLALGIGMVIRLDHHLQESAKIRKIAGHDALTGCFNRKSIEEYGRSNLNRCVHKNQPFTLAVIDCDKFKQLNDIHGHQYGDQVLKLLVESVTKSIGNRGKVGRIGGDEFVVVLPNTHYFEAEAMMSRAGDLFSDATLVRGGRASCSIGMAETITDGIFWERLLDAADDDMYRRKLAKNPSLPFEIMA